MSKINLNDVGSGFNLATVINANNEVIEAEFDNTISRDGSSPNTMLAPLDMNSNRVINIGSPVSESDAARWGDVIDSVDITGLVAPSQTGNSGRYLGTNGSVTSWSNPPTYYEQTALETAAGLTITQSLKTYRPGDFRRYGAVGDGTTNDTTAIRNAISTGHVCYGGGPEFVYQHNTFLSLVRGVTIDLEGATIRPNGNTQSFTRGTSVAATASTTVSSGATIGSRQVVVASATGLVVGQWVLISGGDFPTHDTLSYTCSWTKITAIASTTIDLDRPLPITYSGTTTFAAYNPGVLYDKFEIRNGVFDGSLTTLDTSTGQAIRANGFEKVVIDNIEFKNFDNGGTLTTPVQTFVCIDVFATGCRSTGTVSLNNAWDIQDARCAIVTDNIFDGSCFGVNLTRCEFTSVSGNIFMGRKKFEEDAALGLRSIRGLKFYGCAVAKAVNNEFTDYESPLKGQANFRTLWLGNVVRNGALFSPYSGQTALNIGSQINGVNMCTGIVANNIVENCGGLAIGILGDTAGKYIVAGNQVRRCHANGIQNPTNNCIIVNNIIEDWDLTAAGFYAIRQTGVGATIVGNRFTNSDATRTCMNISLVSGGKYVVRDNVAITANPLGFITENSGTVTITAAATSQATAHGLSVTPGVADILVVPTNSPTTNPGNTWLTSVGTTNFTLNCRTAPGASTATFSWKASVQMPFTAP